jgi:hypothetical protein
VVNPKDTGGAGAPACLTGFKTKLRPARNAEASFGKGGDLPTLNQQINYYPDGSAPQKFTTAVSILDGCKQVSYDSKGTKITGSIRALSLPKLGQRSRAWRLTLSAAGATVEFDVSLVQRGRELEQVVYGDFGPPDLEDFTRVVRVAVAKMPAR